MEGQTYLKCFTNKMFFTKKFCKTFFLKKLLWQKLSYRFFFRGYVCQKLFFRTKLSPKGIHQWFNALRAILWPYSFIIKPLCMNSKTAFPFPIMISKRFFKKIARIILSLQDFFIALITLPMMPLGNSMRHPFWTMTKSYIPYLKILRRFFPIQNYMLRVQTL